LKVLITGATGFLGNAVVPRLLKAGHAVRVLARGAKPTELPDTFPREYVEALPRCTWVQGDVRDEPSVRRAVEGADAVVHLAGLVSRDPRDAHKMYELHVGGTRVVLAEAERAKVKRVVVASSSGTIGVSAARRVATEADDYPIETAGRWPYYLSKIYEEKVALEAAKRGLNVVVLNPSLLLGPGDARLSSTHDVYKFLNGRIPAMPSGGVSFVDVRDAADMFVAALERGNPGERHLLGACNVEFDDFFARLSNLSGVKKPPLRLPKTLKILAAHALERWAHKQNREPDLDAWSVEMGEHWFFIDSSKAERVLGFSPRDPYETLSETVRYLQRHFIA
jgi:dihydroflavonol-4-reductase